MNKFWLLIRNFFKPEVYRLLEFIEQNKECPIGMIAKHFYGNKSLQDHKTFYLLSALSIGHCIGYSGWRKSDLGKDEFPELTLSEELAASFCQNGIYNNKATGRKLRHLAGAPDTNKSPFSWIKIKGIEILDKYRKTQRNSWLTVFSSVIASLISVEIFGLIRKILF